MGRPGLGLVLSGGGAHGIAHLGVLKVMEEAGLRPDYITGVSMGSIIGGMYSLGYSADSIYAILKTCDWETLLGNRIPENKIIYSEKNHAYNSIIALSATSARLSLPSGLINGQLIENTLAYYLWPAADIDDFSELPIPYMCVGSDIIKFRKVDLRSGFLPEAIRASISVPSIFTPLRIDSMLLIDGGLLRNFAASEAVEMGADILIGSYSGFQAYSENELSSVTGIIKQIALYRSLEDFNSEKQLVDILITHKIKNYSKADFSKVDSLYRKGYEDALPYRDKFRRLADSLNSFGEQKPMKNILDKQEYRIDRIDIEGNKLYSKEQIKGLLNISPGQVIRKDELFDRIELLYGRSWFEKVSYRMEPHNDSLTLVIECAEKPKGMIYGSAHYDNYLRAGILLGFSARNLLTKSSEISLDTRIGQFYRAGLQATQYFWKNLRQYMFISFSSDNTLVPMLAMMGEKGDFISRNFCPGAGLGRTLGLNQMVGLSLVFENTNLIPVYDSEKRLKNLSYNYLSSYLEYHVSSLDTKYYPRKGLRLDLSVSGSRLLSESVRSDSVSLSEKLINGRDYSSGRFYSVYGHLQYYISVTGKATVSIGSYLLIRSSADSLAAANSFFLLGGTEPVNRRSVPLTGYHCNELPASGLFSVRTSLDFELAKNFHAGIMADGAVAKLRGRNDSYTLLTGYGLTVGYMSVAGPLQAGIMYGDCSCHRYFNNIKGFLSLGFRF